MAYNCCIPQSQGDTIIAKEKFLSIYLQSCESRLAFPCGGGSLSILQLNPIQAGGGRIPPPPNSLFTITFEKILQ